MSVTRMNVAVMTSMGAAEDSDERARMADRTVERIIVPRKKRVQAFGSERVGTGVGESNRSRGRSTARP